MCLTVKTYTDSLGSCINRKFRNSYTSKVNGRKTWQCCVTACKCIIYTINGEYDGTGKGKLSKHNWTYHHNKWTSLDQQKNDLLVNIIDDITINDKQAHDAYKKQCIDDPKAAKSIPMHETVRKTLYRSEKKSGAIPLPQSGVHANQILSESRLCRNYYGQQLGKCTVTDQELNEFDDVKSVNDRINQLKLQKRQVNLELSKMIQIKHTKFDNFDGQDSLLFLGGCKRGNWQVFAERKSAHILRKAHGLFFDGSGSTTIMSTNQEENNHFSDGMGHQYMFLK